MKKFLRRSNFPLYLIIIICIILFGTCFKTFFSQDDFIHLSYSKNLDKVFKAFNLFTKGDFPFYRPIPTQSYFYFLYNTFGFKVLYYHLFNFLIFSLNIFLLYKFAYSLTRIHWLGILASFYYAVNPVHFAPLYSPAYIHELLYTFFGLGCTISYLNFLYSKKIKFYFFSLFLFIFALMTKESAVVIPFLLVLISIFFEKNIEKKNIVLSLFTFFVTLVIYLLGHFAFYGLATGPSYQVILGKQTLKIFFWYIFWALGTPRILIDFLEPGFKISKVFWQIAKINGIIFFSFFSIFIALLTYLLIAIVKKKKFKLVLFGILWFCIGMVPLLPFPLHHLATEQAFSLVGLSFVLAEITYFSLSANQKILGSLLLIFYFVINMNSILLERRTHWIIYSSLQAENIYNFFQENKQQINEAKYIYFINGKVKIPEYGSSRQLHNALGNGAAIPLFTGRTELKLYFEDINPDENILKNNKTLIINSSDMLGY